MMLAMAATSMGYRTAALDPDADAPAMQVVNYPFVADYTNEDVAVAMSRKCAAVTYEFENVPVATAAACSKVARLLPSPRVLQICQDRIQEKRALVQYGIKVASYAEVRSPEDLIVAAKELRLPAILKTATSGYDGKGQRILRSLAEAQDAANSITFTNEQEFVLEEMVNIYKEVSVVVGRDGRTVKPNSVPFPATENNHKNGILYTSVAPAKLPLALECETKMLACRIADKLEVHGLLAVEMFITKGQEVLVNELAPRPHNSGHYTIEACYTSQFEQLVRTMVGFPLGHPGMKQLAAMVNLFGETWLNASGREPNWGAALEVPGTSLHLYGKHQARVGRKMGHLTVVAKSGVLKKALDAVSRLTT